MSLPGDTLALLLVFLQALGLGLMLLLLDGRSPATRALAVCLFSIGGGILMSGLLSPSLLTSVADSVFESVAILSGIEWARRIARTSRHRLRRSADGLFRAAQILGLVYAGLLLGYHAIAPEAASTDSGELVAVRGYEFAIFAPVLGTALLLSTLAITLLLIIGIDKAEAARLRALVLATPFLLSGIVFRDAWVMLPLSAGLLIFLYGTLQYLIIRSRRGQFLQQFLSPGLARLVNDEGLDRALRQERRRITVLACDLRGFTAYAAVRDSAEVTGLLQAYYGAVGAAATAAGATVKDHAGDGVLILIGAPQPVERHEQVAARLALRLVPAVQALLAGREPALGVGIGLASDDTTIGAIEGAGRLEYVAVGPAVNLAARLCNRAADGEILLAPATAETLQADPAFRLESLGEQPFKGYATPLPVQRLRAGDSDRR